MKQRVVHRLATPAGTFDKDGQVRTRVPLPDKGIQRLRPQCAVGVFRLAFRAQGGIRFLRHLSLPLWRQKFQRCADQGRCICVRVLAQCFGNGTGGITRRVAKVGKG